MSDPRFARFKTDPRFRRIKKDQSKVVVDDRFKGVFDGEKKGKGKKAKAKGRVDKYGRPLADTHERDSLRRFYRLENEDDHQPAAPETPSVVDYARGAVLLESSDEEEDDVQSENGDDSDTASVVALGRDITRPIPIPDEAEIDLDEDSYTDLDAQAAAYSKSHTEHKDDVPQTERTRRLAVVNLDWDHVKATHLYKIFSSLVSPTASSKTTLGGKQKTSGAPVIRGKVLSVRVYPSEFGKERMAREEKEGPPPEVFKNSAVQDEEEINERTIYETGEGEDYDEDALRKYQLERLRYYYAIVECDSEEAASHIYTELEGTELERSANVFDLSFVPDGMDFEDEFRDEATGDVDAPFTAPEFVTDALRHSKVKLTWDEDDAERNLITRRALTKKDIEENDFRAYIASSSSDSDSEGESGKHVKSSAARDRLRSLLLGGNDDQVPEGWGKDAGDDSDVDMEITFTPGLSGQRDANRDETTLEKYQRKMKEKRKNKKEAHKSGAVAAEQESKLDKEDDFFDGQSDADDNEEEADTARTGQTKKKSSKRKKGPSTAVEQDRPVATPEELALLAASDEADKDAKHFDMKAIIKAEKGAKGKRKKMKQKKGDHENELQEDFQIDVKDDRFSAVHEDHAFAIDPSNPHFKKTKNMAALLDERSKRRKKANIASTTQTPSNQDTSTSEGRTDLMRLVESVKRKSAIADTSSGKRRKF